MSTGRLLGSVTQDCAPFGTRDLISKHCIGLSNVSKHPSNVSAGVDRDANHLELLVVEDETNGVTLNGKQLMVQKPAAMKPGDLLCIDDLSFRVMRGTFAHA